MASGEVIKQANKDVFIDRSSTYPSGLDPSGFVPGARNVNVNFVGPDYIYEDQKTAINFTGLNSGLPSWLS